MQVILLANPPASYSLHPLDRRQLRKTSDNAVVAVRSPKAVQNNAEGVLNGGAQVSRE